MARHSDRVTDGGRRAGRSRLRVSVWAIVVCVLVLATAGLGIWFWTLRSATDPIDADPVDAYAQVVSSPPCGQGDETTVRLTGRGVTTTISGCGFADDQRIAVQYLAGHPGVARQAGTSTSGTGGLAGKLLPIGILAAGLVAVLATLALVVERRRSRHISGDGRISVAELRSRRRAADAAGGSAGAHGAGDEASGDEAAGDEAPDDDQAAGGDQAAAPDGDEAAAPGGDDGADRASDDAAEPAQVLGSGFVLVEEQLFTHSGTEAPDEPRQ